MAKTTLNPDLAKLSYADFEKWFKKSTKRKGLDAKKAYEELGGKVDPKKAP